MPVNEYQIQGLDAVLAKLEGLKYETKFKGGRFALRKAAQLVADAAKVNALRIDDPKTANMIAKNIAIRWNARQYKQSGNLAFRIGVLGGARDYSAYGEITTGKSASANPGGDTFYWRFHEFGTEKMAAHPILRPALASNITPAIDEFVKQYGRAIDKAMKKAAKTGVSA